MNSLLFSRSRFCYNFRTIKKAAPSKTVLPFFTIRFRGLHRMVYMSSKQFCPLLKRKTYFYCLPSDKTVLPLMIRLMISLSITIRSFYIFPVRFL